MTAQTVDDVVFWCGPDGDGYLVDASRYTTPKTAAHALVEEIIGRPADATLAISIVLDRANVSGPHTLRRHDDEIEPERVGCGCEDVGWSCELGTGPVVGRYWHFDTPHEVLDKAGHAGDSDRYTGDRVMQNDPSGGES